jgi:group I intron endonuclease
MAVLNLITEPAEAEPFKRWGSVYLVRNGVTGRHYVGQTTQKIRDRWQAHCDNKAYCLGRAIKRHGKESFDVSEIYVSSCREDLDAAEIGFIIEYDCVAPKGYNLRDGGGHRGAVHESTRAIWRAQRAGRKHSAESIERMRKAQTGKKRSEESRKRIREAILKSRGPEVIEKVRAAPSWGVTGHKGVSVSENGKRFKATTTATMNGRRYRIHIGTFDTAKEAHAAYLSVVSDIPAFLAEKEKMNGRRYRKYPEGSLLSSSGRSK